VWDIQSAHGFTHYTAKEASRLDRIFVSRDILKNKQGAETVAAAFTDHLAPMLGLSLTAPLDTQKRYLAYEHDHPA
jgi:endonuclease/exonuclease/phosphatase family metal-dependent hydrolase